jgi:hypothetical protein
LLGFTDSEELRKIFLKTEIAKTMIRQLENEDSTERELVLQIIINLSGEESFQKNFIELNAIHRICHILLSRVEKEIKKEGSESKSDDVFDLTSMISGLNDTRGDTENKIDVNYGNIY